jgi:membrane fusion protein, multidrug efflux system
MRIVKNLAIVITVLSLLYLVKMYFFDASPGSLAMMGKPGPGQASAVKVYVANRAVFTEQITATGTALANEEAMLMPEVSGKVIQIYFKEGEEVAKGKLLVKINDADLQAQLHKIDLQIKLAEEKVARQKQMLTIEGISKEEYDVLVNQVNTLQADRDYLIAQINKTEIRAPFTGTVGLRSISEGAFVNPTTVVASMQQLSPMKIDFSIPEKYSGLLVTGDIITFEVEGVSGSHEAKVIALEPKIDLATRSLKVRALFYERKHNVLPGAFVKISTTAKSSNSILIPTEALIPELKGHKVFVYRSGKAIPAKVLAGTRTDNSVVISEGLENGDTIITSGIMQLKPEALVKITEVIK